MEKEKLDELLERIEEVKDYLPDEYADATITVAPVKKENGIEFTGITILKEGENVSPMLYVENYANAISLDSAFIKMSEDFLQASKENPRMGMASYMDWNKVKDSIVVQVLNTEANKELLNETPHKEIEGTDLSAIYRVVVSEAENSVLSFRVTDALANKYAEQGITLDDIHETAVENIGRTAVVKSIEEVIAEMMEVELEEVSASMAEMDNPPMYILTSESRVNGAGVFLSDSFMDKVAETMGLDEKVTILPSSTQEIIALKTDSMFISECANNPLELAEMVKTINESAVDEQERLSDNVYDYNFKEHSLTICEELTRGNEKSVEQENIEHE